ncbi:hypothetical protein DFH06DRAFT_1443898 [Mycena polygramma]|nr:hypothetical protein DFH06DRAFT_1443898 [Mycena polygramma]
MVNPITQKILEFLCTKLGPINYNEQHTDHADTRPPIEYDLHMPPWLKLESLEYGPQLYSDMVAKFVGTLEERKAVADQSMDLKALGALIGHSSFSARKIVPARPVGEVSVNRIQTRIHDIACTFATLGCFDIDDNEIDTFRSVFTVEDAGEPNTIADLLVGCNNFDEPEDWGSLYSAVVEPRELSHAHFHALCTEEHKNIIAGNPQTILGIYIILWCLQKEYLWTFWPTNDCAGCGKYKKSHAAERADVMGEGGKAPVDAKDAPQPPDTDLEELEEEIERLVAVALVYDDEHHIPPDKATVKKPKEAVKKQNQPETAPGQKRKRDEQDDSEGETEEPPEENLSYKERLEIALDRAIEELETLAPVEDGLLRCMLDAAYFLIQSWGQMVHHNGTIAHLTCHNLGVIMSRHRETKTMVVSKCLQYTDAPILRATALTVYAYQDATERYDRHVEDPEEHPFWTQDPFRGQTKEEGVVREDQAVAEEALAMARREAEAARQAAGVDQAAAAAAQAAAGVAQAVAGVAQAAAGVAQAAAGVATESPLLTKPETKGQKRGRDVKTIWRAYILPSKQPRIIYALDETGPQATQDDNSSFAAVGAIFGLDPSDQQRRVSAGSTHSSGSATSTAPSLFSEQASSSVPTSPATTASFPGSAQSRDGSPFPEKAAGQIGSSGPASATISNAGILLHDILGKSAIGIVWSGKMIPEDGIDEDTSIPIAVKMAVPRDNGDSEATDDERESIRKEGLVYDFLAKSGKQEDIAPRYYGVFEDNVGTVALILDNGGAALQTFDNLTTDQKQTLFATAVEMHSIGVNHNDLVPRNIVQDAEGNLRIIDFHVADVDHICLGKERCDELLEFSGKLEI